jgi:tetratricopeptide (TPR) repeat protein
VTQTLEVARLRRLILLIAFAVSASLSYQASRFWLVDYRIHSNNLDAIEKGVALEPGDAEAWDVLGRHHQLDLADANPSEAIANYQRAVQDDPLSANYWMNLAGAYEDAGDSNGAEEAFEHARAVYPLSADVAWNYGNFLLRQGQDALGYAEIQHAVESDPRLLTLAISRVWRSSRDVNVLLDQVLPSDLNAYFQALDFFASIRQPSPALAVWHRLTALGKTIVLKKTFLFFDELIQDDRSSDAKRVWTEALAAAGLSHYPPLKNSLIWNGDFAHEFENGGLGWRWNSPVGAAIDFDTVPLSYGVRSVRLDFGGGRNLDLSVPMQYVPVEPNQHLHFHAYLQTEGITTESGVRFSIIDPNQYAVDVKTENLIGSHHWTAAEADVSVSPRTHFLLVRLYREPSRLFDNKLGGTVWVADVKLTPADVNVAADAAVGAGKLPQ